MTLMVFSNQNILQLCNLQFNPHHLDEPAVGAELPVSPFPEGWKHQERPSQGAVSSRARSQLLNSLFPSKTGLESHSCSWKGTLLSHSLIEANWAIAGTFPPSTLSTPALQVTEFC